MARTVLVVIVLFGLVSVTKADLLEKLKAEPPGASDIDYIRLYITERIKALWQDISESNEINQSTMADIELLRAFAGFYSNLTKVKDNIDDSGFYYVGTNWYYAQAQSEVDNIETYYETFLRFQRDHFAGGGIKKPPLAWTDLAGTYLQKTEVGLPKSMEKLHEYAAVRTDHSNMTMFSQILKEMRYSTCNLQQSSQQLLYNLYTTIALAELKGYVMIQYSYMLLRLYNKGNFTVESQLARSNYEERTLVEINAVREAMSEADRSVYNCDPKQYVEGHNYVKMTKLLQGYIENEVNLNRYSTCRENCAYYYYTEYNGCFKNKFCSQQTSCKGKVVECRYIDSDMNICKSSDPQRRYDWVEYENGRTLGTKGTCENRHFYKVDSWWRYLFWHCSYCFCLCDEQDETSEKYINLRDVTSDIENNKVVTGVRITKKNQIIHLQIEQGVLEPRGRVNKSSTSWKAVEDYKISDHKMEDKRDYFTMSWKERSLDLDDIICPENHVVTGVRFRHIGPHVNIEVRATPINFTTGEVFHAGYSHWIGNDNTEVNGRKPVPMINPDIPIRKGPNMMDSEHNQYVVFQATSMDTDASQNTVPYFDAQPLSSKAFPIAGLGLHHRGKAGSGGFVAPKLISYDYSRHLIPQFATFD